MNTLTDILKEQTESLKTQYIQQTEDWAFKYYDIVIERTTWNDEKWAKFLNVETTIANSNTSLSFVTFHNGFFNTKKAREYHKLKSEAYNFKRMTKLNYIEKQKQLAELHYEDSILKLAYRIEKKNLNQNNLSVKTSHIGVNIETVLTDGIKTVKAFTIIARGPIQRPHYRYLIK